KLSDVLDAVGEFGTFQRRLVALTFIPNIMAGFFMFADHFVFVGHKPYCNSSWFPALGSNLTKSEQLNLTLPRDSSDSFLNCHMYLPVSWDLPSIIQFGLNYTDKCQDGWIYPNTPLQSPNNEFDLMCDMEHNKKVVQSTYIAGILMGSITFGILSDKMGRYPTILLSLLGLIIFGFGTAFVNSFRQYLFFRFCVSQAVVGYTITSVSLVTEWLLGEHRAHAIILGHCSFCVGIIFLAGLAYTFYHWRLLFLLGGALVFPLIFYIWMLPESPRWLMMTGSLKEARKVLCYAASVNKKTIPFSLLKELHIHGKRVTKASVLDFCKNKQLLKLSVILAIVWFTMSYCFYSLSFILKDLGVNIYLRQVFLGIMGVSARLFYVFLLEQIGTKWTLAMTFLIATIMTLILHFLPEGAPVVVTVLDVVGKITTAAALTITFMFYAELFPTVISQMGMGLVGILSWIGSIIRPLVILLEEYYVGLPLLIIGSFPIVVGLLCILLQEMCGQALKDDVEDLEQRSHLQSPKSVPQEKKIDPTGRTSCPGLVFVSSTYL
uniref:Major facilitator superfamily (MFS) profile domain-containing protein n=1 Tax=Otolemur garnettii TaxID=30611 RepID=H0WNP7_OTOGA